MLSVKRVNALIGIKSEEERDGSVCRYDLIKGVRVAYRRSGCRGGVSFEECRMRIRFD